ncbi:Mur ligase [Pyronema domesticum]|nr:Mur ligase [Pyronema domesticum]
MATTTRTYEDAIRSLNSLQSNFAILSAIRASGATMNAQAIPEMRSWVAASGHSPSDFDTLNLLHIAGTKGKGSTAAFCSSILSQYPTQRKIGLYTSPHLRAVRERIQINNKPLSEELFAKYFFEVWDAIEESVGKEVVKPVYFRFLTLTALHAFLREGVDAAVIEVGVGGEYDSTNVIEKPTATGVTSLGIDHVGVLGNTIEEIAWHKGGVYKPSAVALSVEQLETAQEVLRKRAEENGVEFRVVPVHKDIIEGRVKLGLEAEFQRGNASLAAELVHEHLKKVGVESGYNADKPLPQEIIKGLESVVWPGRCQVLKQGDVEWNIDGAHTMESLEACGKWFSGRIAEGKKRVLIFNQQKRDAPEKLMGALADSLKKYTGKDKLFDTAVFCTNITFKEAGYKPDLLSVGSDTAAVQALTVQKALATAWSEVDPSTQTHAVATIEEAVEIAKSEGDVQVLVTGSLHLVGGLLEVIDN